MQDTSRKHENSSFPYLKTENWLKKPLREEHPDLEQI